jgi:hypothetical protein
MKPRLWIPLCALLVLASSLAAALFFAGLEGMEMAGQGH